MTEASREARKQLRVVIADDSALMRRHLKFVLSNIEGLVICGVAENGAEAVQLVRELYPDVAVLDISMPYKSGIEVLREIRQDNHSTIIIMFTASGPGRTSFWIRVRPQSWWKSANVCWPSNVKQQAFILPLLTSPEKGQQSIFSYRCSLRVLTLKKPQHGAHDREKYRLACRNRKPSPRGSFRRWSCAGFTRISLSMLLS